MQCGRGQTRRARAARLLPAQCGVQLPTQIGAARLAVLGPVRLGVRALALLVVPLLQPAQLPVVLLDGLAGGALLVLQRVVHRIAQVLQRGGLQRLGPPVVEVLVARERDGRVRKLWPLEPSLGLQHTVRRSLRLAAAVCSGCTVPLEWVLRHNFMGERRRAQLVPFGPRGRGAELRQRQRVHAVLCGRRSAVLASAISETVVLS